MPLADLLERSRASDQFKRETRALAAQPYGSAPSGSAVVCTRQMPAVKVVRLLTQLVRQLPAESIERVEITGRSGCSDFGGTVLVVAAGTTRVFEFVWDCRWRAAEEGWLDHWGEPDQIRAAREFDWDCFSRWSERAPGAASHEHPRISRTA